MARPANPITSKKNPRVKRAASLRKSSHRQRQGRFLIDGVREIRRASAGGVPFEEVFVCRQLCTSAQAQALLDELPEQIEQVEVSAEVFSKLCYGERTEGLLVVGRAAPRELAALRLPPDPLVVVLEGIEKPGNLGAVLRSADGAGVSAVIVADGQTDLLNPNVIRASLGTVFTLSIAQADSEETFHWLSEQQLQICATRPQASANYTDIDYRRPTALILGSETAGLSAVWSGQHLRTIALPMLGEADSLNVSATAAVLFYEALRQRRP